MSKALYAFFTSKRDVDFTIKYEDKEIQCHKLIYKANVTSLDGNSVVVESSPEFDFGHLYSAVSYMYKPLISVTTIDNDVRIIKACESLGPVSYVDDLKRKVFYHYPVSVSDIPLYVSFCNQYFSGDMSYKRCASLLDSSDLKEDEIKLDSSHGISIAKYIRTAEGSVRLSKMTGMEITDIVNATDFFDYAEYFKIKTLCSSEPYNIDEMFLPFKETIDLIEADNYFSLHSILFFVKDNGIIQGFSKFHINIKSKEGEIPDGTIAGTFSKMEKSDDLITITLDKWVTGYTDQNRSLFLLQT